MIKNGEVGSVRHGSICKQLIEIDSRYEQTTRVAEQGNGKSDKRGDVVIVIGGRLNDEAGTSLIVVWIVWVVGVNMHDCLFACLADDVYFHTMSQQMRRRNPEHGTYKCRNEVRNDNRLTRGQTHDMFDDALGVRIIVLALLLHFSNEAFVTTACTQHSSQLATKLLFFFFQCRCCSRRRR